MKLVRNTRTDGTCKYALLRLDKLREAKGDLTKEDILAIAGDLAPYIEFGEIGTEDEFFAIKLKDINAPPALLAYAGSSYDNGDPFFAIDVEELANRSGSAHESCKIPD